jgi:hypothetical protein
LVASDNTSVGSPDVASVILVASLLDVLEDQQHRGPRAHRKLRHEYQLALRLVHGKLPVGS